MGRVLIAFQNYTSDEAGGHVLNMLLNVWFGFSPVLRNPEERQTTDQEKNRLEFEGERFTHDSSAQ
jgi:hypothetical protein